MAIKKIRITNFKSFNELEIDLGKFNVLIGANASGKSNFTQIFKFLGDIVNSGLNNAISMQGGVEYLRNISNEPLENFYLNVIYDEEFGGPIKKSRKLGLIGFKIYETSYEFSLEFRKKGFGYKITKDCIRQRCNFIKYRLEKEKKKGEQFEIIEEEKKIGDGEIIISKSNGKVNFELHKGKESPIKKDDIFPPFLKERKFKPDTLLFERPFFFITIPLGHFINISIYDFDSKLSKKSNPITGEAELKEDGSNLSIVLKNIIENKDKKRKLFNLVNDLLPFIKDLDVEKFKDKSLLFKLLEIYSKKQYLPSYLISDGTINIISLIIALYFEEKPLIIIEEPERNIHPYLISKIVNVMKDISNKKQIIVTTHNPEMVKYAGLENILLVSRDKEGFSTINRPADKEEIKTFLKNDIGIEELYVQSLLEV